MRGIDSKLNLSDELIEKVASYLASLKIRRRGLYDER